MTQLLQCGHAANAVDGDGNPVCAICVGVDPGAIFVVETPPDLTGRVARCSSRADTPGSGHGEKPSSFDLPFFEYRGEGSPAATESCKHCGYLRVAHEVTRPRRACSGFEAHGPWECDTYYDGCRGWD